MVDTVTQAFPSGFFQGRLDASAATTSTAGTVKQAATQADSTATDVAGLVTDFNALLDKLQTAGLMA